jgi:hypothetical protein
MLRCAANLTAQPISVYDSLFGFCAPCISAFLSSLQISVLPSALPRSKAEEAPRQGEFQPFLEDQVQANGSAPGDEQDRGPTAPKVDSQKDKEE